MSSKDTQGLFDFLFSEEENETCSDAGCRARERLERNRIEAAQKDVARAEEQFQKNPSPASAYELGECYQQLIEIFSSREHLPQRKAVKRSLLKLLQWMDQRGIELGDAREMLISLQIESYYDGGWDD
jgi:hypothetical protein